MIKRILLIFYLLNVIQKVNTINNGISILNNSNILKDNNEIHSNNISRHTSNNFDNQERIVGNSLITNDSAFDNDTSGRDENNTKTNENVNLENDNKETKSTVDNYEISDDINNKERNEKDFKQNINENTHKQNTNKESHFKNDAIYKNRLQNGDHKKTTTGENSFNKNSRTKEGKRKNVAKYDIPKNVLGQNNLITNTFRKGNSNDKKMMNDNAEADTCLTGYMTDVQNWVNENGELRPDIEKRMALDMSRKENVVQTLQQEMTMFRYQQKREIRYLSMAKCDLKRVPSVFHMEDSQGRALHATIEYLTLYGNKFMDISKAGVQYEEFLNATDALQLANIALQTSTSGGSTWSLGFNQLGSFTKLKELDLRRCSIQMLTQNIFRNMPKLEALYLGENMISHISSQTFTGLYNLLHLDLSRNNDGKEDDKLLFETITLFHNLSSLISLDFSKTQILSRHSGIFNYLPKTLQKLSICSTGLTFLPSNAFTNTSLKYFDISRNPKILDTGIPLRGLENKLEILYAKYINLKSLNTFLNFTKLKVLNLEGNELLSVPNRTAKSLTNLQILNLDGNRISTWFEKIFAYMKNLMFLSLRENNLNMLTIQMLEDFKNISYIGVSANFIVCNCISRELYELAYRNQHRPLLPITRVRTSPFFFHRGFFDFQQLVSQRKNITRVTTNSSLYEELEFDGNFVLYDYDDISYKCLMITQATPVPLFEVNTCAQSKREMEYDMIINKGWKKLLFLIIIPAVIFPIMIFLYVFRRNLKYFCITMRNSATLSLINKDKVVDNDTIFNYDVFVSYCNEDRLWVLDHLLPHVEKDCNVSVCLHERDFQVGLSILENIVSCMDRSRSIMLVISQRFLLSQWCQFEMHLAQHRLLETRREDLILVLLEEIPRRLRPTTLHYLMLTKTYIVWPKNESERSVFWKRLTRSILTFRVKGQENISLA